MTTPQPHPAESAVAVSPFRARHGGAPNALWVTVAGWAGALEKRFGPTVVVVPGGVLTPAQVRAQVVTLGATPPEARLRRRPPEMFVTAAKDLRALRDGRRFTRQVSELRLDNPPAMVWQQHNLFNRGGDRLARRVGAPFVLFVDAPVVWETARWGVRRPGWGHLAERTEAAVFRSADVVACVTDSVAEHVVELGADRRRVVVTPCAADPDEFRPGCDRDTVRAALGLAPGEVVVGWAGGFRRFHGLEKLVDAAALALPRSATPATMLLVGDGPERCTIERKLAVRRVPAIFTGARPHTEMPGLLAAMDIAVVTAHDKETFHYAPLKLSEYMASGLAVVVPDAGQLPATVVDDEHGLVVPADDLRALAGALTRLIGDEALRRRLGDAAVIRARELLSWDKVLDDVVLRVEEVRSERSPIPAPP